jgi:large subunit ribosomal protein L16
MGGEEITEEIAKEAMRLAQYKLPVKTKFISSDINLSSDSSAEGKTGKDSKEEVKK